MADVFSKQKRSRVMAAIRSKGNKDTELKLISIFRANGITGWRRNQMIQGRPDFVFRRERMIIFVDGCFWHGCPKHGRVPSSNTDYWKLKLARNRARDTRVVRVLRASGWYVVRFWEHDLSNTSKMLGRLEKARNSSRLSLRTRVPRQK